MSNTQQQQGLAEFTITRVIQAPREVVFKAWTEPAQVERWWGPRYFTTRVRAWEARPGGRIDLDMLWPDGRPERMGGEFREVEPPARLVFTTTAAFDAQGNPQLEALDIVVLTPDGSGKTTLWVHEVMTRAEPAVAQALAGAEEGLRQTIDKLVEYLEGGAGSGDK